MPKNTSSMQFSLDKPIRDWLEKQRLEGETSISLVAKRRLIDLYEIESILGKIEPQKDLLINPDEFENIKQRLLKLEEEFGKHLERFIEMKITLNNLQKGEK